MEQSLYKLFAKSAFFFIVGVVLASLFVWCLLQGALVHLSGDSTIAIAYYFIAWLAGIGALALYMQAKTLFYYVKITK
ncbi:MAG: hypothetical protein ABH854_05245 [Candidatus Diapherotrites archaeon]|nr:hypothetical protein [Candidatus Micrarchaeota archaeon]MBU1939566.1 hypothetical protein [Candidatus Micrarchaeota archaeon]